MSNHSCQPPIAPLGRSAWTWITPALATVIVLLIVVTGSNQQWFLALNAHAAVISPVIWSGLTVTASTGGGYAILAACLPWWPRWSAAALLALPAGAIYTHAIKGVIDMQRPAGVLSPEVFNIIGNVIRHHAVPSGHSVTAFGIAAVIALCCIGEGRRRLPWLVLIVAALLSFSRIAVGAHWPLDVAIGAGGGWLCGVLGVWLSAQWRFWQRDSGVRVMAVILGVSALWLFFDDLKYPDGEWAQYALATLGTLGTLTALVVGRRWSRA